MTLHSALLTLPCYVIERTIPPEIGRRRTFWCVLICLGKWYTYRRIIFTTSTFGVCVLLALLILMKYGNAFSTFVLGALCYHGEVRQLLMSRFAQLNLDRPGPSLHTILMPSELYVRTRYRNATLAQNRPVASWPALRTSDVVVPEQTNVERNVVCTHTLFIVAPAFGGYADVGRNVPNDGNICMCAPVCLYVCMCDYSFASSGGPRCEKCG